MELAAIERQGRGIGTVGCYGFPTGFRDVLGLEVTGPPNANCTSAIILLRALAEQRRPSLPNATVERRAG